MKGLVLLVPLIALVGCASQGTGPSGTTAPRSTEMQDAQGAVYRVESTGTVTDAVPIASPAERVWAVLPGVYTQAGLSGVVLDEARKIFGQRETTVRQRLAGTQVSRYLSCGSRLGIPNADAYSVNVQIRTYVEATGAETSSVRTQVSARARAPGGSDPWVQCGSTNALELRIAELIRTHLAVVGGS
ncbi:hypothetical protein BH23GEM9_BH23GEM9_09390 [soil metagenome]